MYKDTKHLCEDFIVKERDTSGRSGYILMWVGCENGRRAGNFYRCDKFHGLMCPYHWKPTFNPVGA
jgi:hypothetical protein